MKGSKDPKQYLHAEQPPGIWFFTHPTRPRPFCNFSACREEVPVSAGLTIGSAFSFLKKCAAAAPLRPTPKIRNLSFWHIAYGYRLLVRARVATASCCGFYGVLFVKRDLCEFFVPQVRDRPHCCRKNNSWRERVLSEFNQIMWFPLPLICVDSGMKLK